jgi:antimicrobial peptide system SdpB family protein
MSADPLSLDDVGRWLRTRISRDPWTVTLGLARTLLALGMAGTLLATPASVLFTPVAGLPHGATCGGQAAFSAFCLGGNTHRQILTLIWGLVCLAIATGWRPRVTGLVQWWIAYSFFLTTTLPDGGDQVMAVMTLFLLPIVLTDRRRWHWTPSERDGEPLGLSKCVAGWGLFFVRLQVAVIYLDSSVSKLGVSQWSNGSAMYYWLRNPVFGVRPSAVGFEGRLLGLSGVVEPFTFGVMLLEFMIGVAFLLPRRARKRLFFAGLALHLGIAVVMGLVSFGFAMTASLVIYLLPGDEVPGIVRAASKLGSRASRRRRLASDQIGSSSPLEV